MICQNCKHQIPKGQEAYICNEVTKFKNLRVCKYYYSKLKIGNNRGESRQSLIQTYKNWLARI